MFRTKILLPLLLLLTLLFFRHEFVSFFHTLASHGDFLWLGILPSFLPPLFHSPPPGERRLPFLSAPPQKSGVRIYVRFHGGKQGEEEVGEKRKEGRRRVIIGASSSSFFRPSRQFPKAKAKKKLFIPPKKAFTIQN